tara:strand:- start:578 stop:787 length:210 start_codon:yes stop_codon:yes gene_type:complete
MTPDFCPICKNPPYFCDCEESQARVTRLIITKEEAEALYAYFLDAGYISHEFHSKVHDFIAKLKKHLGQ